MAISGFTTETIKRLLVGAGAVYVNYDKQPATVTDYQFGTGDGMTKVFSTGKTDIVPASEVIEVDGVAKKRGIDYTINYKTGVVIFGTAPANSAVLTISCQTGRFLLGATRGGNEFTVEREIKTIEIDGVRGKAKGMRTLISESATIKSNILEFSSKALYAALAGLDISVDTNGNEVIKSVSGLSTISTDYYWDDVALVGEISGSSTPAIIVIKNALGDGNLSIKAEDKNEAAYEAIFSAHYDPSNFDAPIWEIRLPQIT